MAIFLTLLHSERPKLFTILAFLSAVRLKYSLSIKSVQTIVSVLVSSCILSKQFKMSGYTSGESNFAIYCFASILHGCQLLLPGSRFIPLRVNSREANRKSQKLFPILTRILPKDMLCLNRPGPGCSKLTTSLVNETLKFQTLVSQICQYFLLKNCEKLLRCKSFSHFVNKKYQCIW